MQAPSPGWGLRSVLEHAQNLGCLLEFGNPTAVGIRGLAPRVSPARGLWCGVVSSDFVTSVEVPSTGQGRGPRQPSLCENWTWPLHCPCPFRSVPRQPAHCPLVPSGVYAYSALSSSPPGFQKEPCEKKKTSLLLFETTDSRENVLKSLCIWKVMLFKKKEVEKFYSLLKFKNRDHTNDDN